MKIMDRYVITTFLKNYFIAFFVLVGLYIVLDMVFKFDDIIQIQQRSAEQGVQSVFALVWDLADFYFYQALGFFVQLAGIIPGVAASFTLLRLTRFNELTAFLAAGVPLLRIATPIILCAVLLSGLVVIDQELVIPNIIPKLMRKYDNLRGSGPTFQIPAMQDSSRGLLIAGRYHPPTFDTPARMDVVDVIERNAELQPTAHLF